MPMKMSLVLYVFYFIRIEKLTMKYAKTRNHSFLERSIAMMKECIIALWAMTKCRLRKKLLQSKSGSAEIHMCISIVKLLN